MSNPNIPTYKKPVFWVVAVAVIAVIAVVAYILYGVFAPSNIGANSELDRLSISIQALDTSAETAGIAILWKNKTENDITYGEAFRFYRLENGQLVDTDLLDNRAFDSVGYILSPKKHAEKHYSLKDYDLKDGAYRFESTVNLNNDPSSYKVWVGFQIENGKLVKAPRSTKQCTHAWLNATCTTKKTCLLCQTPEGEPLGHKWEDATCLKPKTCRVCAVTEGNSVPHTYVDATCETPKTCSACGETVGKALGHEYLNITCTDGGKCSRCAQKGTETLPHTVSDATCVTDAACTVCKFVVSEALGHDYTEATCTEDGACVRCGEIDTYAYGHSYTGGTCYEREVCEICGDVGDYKDHRILLPKTCKGGYCKDCGQLVGEPGTHMFLSNGYCPWCNLYDPEFDQYRWLDP